MIEKQRFDTFLLLESEKSGAQNQKPCTKTYQNDEKIAILDHFEDIRKTLTKKNIFGKISYKLKWKNILENPS